MILTLDNLLPYFRGISRPLVVACGCFDLLTVGHIRHLQAAKKFGKCLVVLVTGDWFVNKGPDRPVFPESVRAEIVDALRCVDYAIVNSHPTAIETIRILSPDVYVKGSEYRGRSNLALEAEAEAVRAVGGRLEFTDTEEMHTTDVLDRLVRTRVNTDLVDKGVRVWK